MSEIIDLNDLKNEIRNFVSERDWEQFHSPKNLAMALSVEVSELVEIFQWLDQEDSKNIMEKASKKSNVEEELADIFYYLLRLSDVLGVDLKAVLKNKIKKNAEKYPVEKAKGNAMKYNEYNT